MAYVRAVKTASGATAVQIVWSSRRGSRQIEHIGSGHDEAEVEALRAAARQRLAGGQTELDLGVDDGASAAGPLTIVGSQAAHLWDALSRAYDALGFDRVAGAEDVFRSLVLARIIEPTSKADSLRVLAEVGVSGPSYPTLGRRLPGYATAEFAAALATACAAHAALGPASLVLYDVSTLYFETDTADEFRKPGFSKERRLEPQITVGLLTDATGFPLMVSAFEGNRAETTTMLPVLRSFMTAHGLADVTVVADAGMVSAGNQEAIEDAGLSFILGAKIRTCRTWSPSGAASTRMPRFPTGTCSPSRGRPPTRRKPLVGGTRRCSISTGPTGPGARCVASTSRSPRLSPRSPGRRRSSATGSCS